MDNRTRELAKHGQGQKSAVKNYGSFGVLNNSVVNKSGEDVYHQGDRVRTLGNSVFKNGRYEGTLR